MKKKFVYSVIIIVAILLQTTFLPTVFDKNTVPDGVLMLVLALAVLDGFAGVFGWAILAGVLYDLATYVPVGWHVIPFLLMIYFVSFFSRRLSLETKTTGVLLFVLFVLVAIIFSHLVVGLQASSEFNFFRVFGKSFGGIDSFLLQWLYSVSFFFLWFYLVRKTKKFFILEN